MFQKRKIAKKRAAFQPILSIRQKQEDALSIMTLDARKNQNSNIAKSIFEFRI